MRGGLSYRAGLLSDVTCQRISIHAMQCLRPIKTMSWPPHSTSLL
jgi:hypothetical protein